MVLKGLNIVIGGPTSPLWAPARAPAWAPARAVLIEPG